MGTTVSNEHVEEQPNTSTGSDERRAAPLSRQRFLGRVGGVAAAAATAGVLGDLPVGGRPRNVRAAAVGTTSAAARADRAYSIRLSAARAERSRSLPDHPTNGDETLYAGTFIGNFTKGLPHNTLGVVDPTAYAALVTALQSGRPAAFEAIPLGGTAKLASPQAALAFVLEGPDPQSLTVPAPPAFNSAQEAAEMAELYWAALARDVPFASYAMDPLIGKVAADLSRLSDFRGPKVGGAVTSATLFRGGMPGDLTGPYLSQFFWLPVAYGALKMVQQYPIAPSKDHLTTYAEWLNVQQGGYKAPSPASVPAKPAPVRYMSSGRDLAAYLHVDFNYQAFLNACLILNKMMAPLNSGNPYLHSKTQAGNTDFGIQHALDLVAKVANAALKAVWYQKWAVHRRLRPEAFGGWVHNHKTGSARYPIHTDLLTTSTVLTAITQKYGSYLLPMADPEGCPMHPSYPAAHMAVAGACVTALKAWYDETFALPEPVVASADGTTLQPYTGDALTVGNELNKLATNYVTGRIWEGFHWRSDGIEGLKLGEAVTLGILADERGTFNETWAGFTLTKFDGTTITV
jgi:hypothetical protein